MGITTGKNSNNLIMKIKPVQLNETEDMILLKSRHTIYSEGQFILPPNCML